MKTLFLAFIFSLALLGCQKEESLTKNEEANPLIQRSPGDGLNGGGSNGTEHFDFIVDGVIYKSTNPQYIESGILVSILSDVAIDNIIQLESFTNISIPDTLVLNEFITTVSYNKTFSSRYQPQSGQMIISELDTNKIVGTFNFIGENTLDSTDTVVITGGNFLVFR